MADGIPPARMSCPSPQPRPPPPQPAPLSGRMVLSEAENASTIPQLSELATAVVFVLTELAAELSVRVPGPSCALGLFSRPNLRSGDTCAVFLRAGVVTESLSFLPGKEINQSSLMEARGIRKTAAMSS